MDEDIGRLGVMTVGLDSDDTTRMHVGFFHTQSFTKGNVPSSRKLIDILRFSRKKLSLR
jgi:hypothetical protein